MQDMSEMAQNNEADVENLQTLIRRLDEPAGIPSQCYRMPKVNVNGKLVALCKRYMKGKAHDEQNCALAHVAFEHRPPCVSYERGGICPRGSECWYPHIDKVEKFSAKLAVRCGIQCGHRVVSRLLQIIRGKQGMSCVTGFLRSSATPLADIAVFVDSELGYEEIICTIMSDIDLRNVITTVYKIDQVVESLEEVCKGVRYMETFDQTRVQGFPRRTTEHVEEALHCKGSRKCTSVIDVIEGMGYYYYGVRRERRCGKVLDKRADEELLVYLPLLPIGRYWPFADIQSRKKISKAVCRAFFKLDEAVRHALIPIKEHWNCVDIGAAPGGWVQKLLECITKDNAVGVHPGGRVIAVDPADLELDTLPPSVKHLQHLATETEQFKASVADALGDSSKINIITCDANVHPHMGARAMLYLEDLYADDIWFILSLKKFCRSLSQWQRDICAVVGLVQQHGFSCQVVHLFANAHREKTLIAHKYR